MADIWGDQGGVSHKKGHQEVLLVPLCLASYLSDRSLASCPTRGGPSSGSTWLPGTREAAEG